MGKTCVICGKSSGIYPLCRHHLEMKAAGEVVKCENCGTWYEVKDGCPNCNQYTEEEKKMKRKNNILTKCYENKEELDRWLSG